jgi:cytochrome c-type biogenesis protein CcsB
MFLKELIKYLVFLPFFLTQATLATPVQAAKILFLEVPQIEKLEFLFQNITFLSLLCTTFFYWFSSTFDNNKTFTKLTVAPLQKNKDVNNMPFLFMLTSNLFLVLLLIVRWEKSGHFPLSNLYESLMFLSWCCTFLFIIYKNQKQNRTKLSQLNLFLNTPQNGVISETSNQSQTQELSLVPNNSLGALIRVFFFGSSSRNVEPLRITVNKTQEITNLTSQSDASVHQEFDSLKGLNTQFEKIVGALIATSALLLNAFATFSLPKEMQEAAPLVPALQSNWLMMHVTVMIISYATLIIGSLLSILYLILTMSTSFFNTMELSERATFKNEQNMFNILFFFNLAKPDALLKKNSPFDFLGKQELTKNYLDALSYRFIGLGFPFLTIGILSGAVWANEAWGSYWSWDPKETWALLTWLVFAIYLHTRLTKGWEGNKPAAIASLGFLVVWFCYLGVNLIGEGLHSYGFLN